MPRPPPANPDQSSHDPNNAPPDHASSPDPSPPPIPDILLHRPANAPASEPATAGRGNKQFAERLVQISVIGSNFAFSVMAAGLIGWAVQTWLWKAAAPWPLVVGLALGLILGFYRFIREALKAINEDTPTKKP